jgi:hypothetical protein
MAGRVGGELTRRGSATPFPAVASIPQIAFVRMPAGLNLGADGFETHYQAWRTS